MNKKSIWGAEFGGFSSPKAIETPNNGGKIHFAPHFFPWNTREHAISGAATYDWKNEHHGQ